MLQVVIEPVRVVSSFQKRLGSKLNKNRENEKSEKGKRERKESDLGNRYFQEYLNSPYSYTSNALHILFLLLVWIALLAAYSYVVTILSNRSLKHMGPLSFPHVDHVVTN